MTDELSDIKEQQINTNNNSKETSAGEGRQQLLDAYAAAGLPLNFAWFHSISVEFSEISFKEKIGHGSYGVVYKAFWRDRYVAVKEFGPKTEQKAITTEVKQLSRVQHPNIIALYGIASNQMSTYLLMEYAEGGSLYDFLHGKVKPKYTAAHALNWALQCAEGVAYLHAMKPKPLIHRDLKPLNLLLTDKGRILKICDFGTVADKATLMTNNKGSAAWMAPEVFEGSKYTEKCDIFSWGIVLWEVLSRQKPFHDVDNTYSIMWKIHKGERPPLHPDFPEPLKDLMIACWKTKPELRPSMNYVVDVMNKMVLEFPGAEEPLEYEFINQQIISSNTGTTNGDNFTLNFSSFTSSNYSFKSSEITQESSINNTTSSTSTACEELNYSRHMQPVHTDAGVSRCWSIIPEESESTITNDCTSDIKEEFNLISTAESAQRYETIRNNMLQMASIPMTPLEIDIDPHTWDFNTSDSLLTKSDGKERLTVTDSKPLMIADKLSHRTIEELTPPINDDEINNLHKTKDQEEREVEEKSEQELDVEDSEDNCQSWHEMLDPELQPEPPLENNIESQEIYRKHKCLAKEYLKVDTDLYYAQDYKEKCLQELSPEERELKEDLIKKMNEKEELLELYNTLKQQLEVLRMGECGTESRSSVENAQPGNANCNNNNNELVTPDNWVVIDRNQNM